MIKKELKEGLKLKVIKEGLQTYFEFRNKIILPVETIVTVVDATGSNVLVQLDDGTTVYFNWGYYKSFVEHYSGEKNKVENQVLFLMDHLMAVI